MFTQSCHNFKALITRIYLSIDYTPICSRSVDISAYVLDARARTWRSSSSEQSACRQPAVSKSHSHLFAVALTTTKDVTERKTLERELRDRNQHHRIFYSKIVVVVFPSPTQHISLFISVVFISVCKWSHAEPTTLLYSHRWATQCRIYLFIHYMVCVMGSVTVIVYIASHTHITHPYRKTWSYRAKHVRSSFTKRKFFLENNERMCQCDTHTHHTPTHTHMCAHPRLHHIDTHSHTQTNVPSINYKISHSQAASTKSAVDRRRTHHRLNY